EFVQRASHTQRSCAIPLLVRVHHEWNIIPDMLAHRCHAANIFLIIRKSYLDLDSANAFLNGLSSTVFDLFDCCIEEATGGVVGPHGITVRTKKFGQR